VGAFICFLVAVILLAISAFWLPNPPVRVGLGWLGLAVGFLGFVVQNWPA
jgi:hypothetical protein